MQTAFVKGMRQATNRKAMATYRWQLLLKSSVPNRHHSRKSFDTEAVTATGDRIPSVFQYHHPRFWWKLKLILVSCYFLFHGTCGKVESSLNFLHRCVWDRKSTSKKKNYAVPYEHSTRREVLTSEPSLPSSLFQPGLPGSGVQFPLSCKDTKWPAGRPKTVQCSKDFASFLCKIGAKQQ